jgi:hypothetical protein
MMKTIHLSSAHGLTMVAAVLIQQLPAILSHALRGECMVSTRCMTAVVIYLPSKFDMEECLVLVFFVWSFIKFWYIAICRNASKMFHYPLLDPEIQDESECKYLPLLPYLPCHDDPLSECKFWDKTADFITYPDLFLSTILTHLSLQWCILGLQNYFLMEVALVTVSPSIPLHVGHRMLYVFLQF